MPTMYIVKVQYNLASYLYNNKIIYIIKDYNIINS